MRSPALIGSAVVSSIHPVSAVVEPDELIAISPLISPTPAWLVTLYPAGPKYVPPPAVVFIGQLMLTPRWSLNRL